MPPNLLYSISALQSCRHLKVKAFKQDDEPPVPGAASPSDRISEGASQSPPSA